MIRWWQYHNFSHLGQCSQFCLHITVIISQQALYSNCNYLHMNQRSKSQKLVSKNTSYLRKPTTHLQQINSSLIQQLDDLEERIETSKPILLSIYDKVKRKQAQFQQQIAQQTHQVEQGHQLIKQYQHLNRQSAKIMHKNGIIDEFKGLSNYRTASAKQLATAHHQPSQAGLGQYKSMKLLDIGKENVGQLQNCRSIVEEYRSLKNEQEGREGTAQISADQIYARYKSKLEDKRGDSTLSRLRRLSKEIDKDMEALKLKKCQSSLSLKTKHPPKPINPINLPKKDKKTYFLELQRKKLARM